MSGVGPLPTFVVGGAMRSGTTTLHRWLSGHPDVFMSPVKEIQFFSWDELWARGPDWYRSHFAAWNGEAAIGEASPGYLYNAEAPARISAHLPDVRFVAVLREPVSRAYSHWWFRRTAGRERRSFEVAMGLDRPRAPSDYELRGRYAEQLERVFAHIPPDRVHVMLTDDLHDDPSGTFSVLCEFLGVDGSVQPEVVGTAANRREDNRGFGVRWRRGWWTKVPRFARPYVNRWAYRRLEWRPMADDTRRALVERFSPHNDRLQQLIGRDLSRWSDAL